MCGWIDRSAQTWLLDSSNAPHKRLGIGDSDSADFWNPTGSGPPESGPAEFCPTRSVV